MMAAVHGSKTKVYAPGFDFGDFLRQLKLSRAKDVADATNFNSDGWKEFVAGLKDGTLSAEGLWVGTPDVETDIDPVMATLDDDVARTWSYHPNGDVFGVRSKLITGIITKWEAESPTEDINKCSLEVQSSKDGVGVEEVLVHRALASAAIATDSAGTAIDNGASSANGGVGYLLVTENATPGTAAVKIQHSVDNSVWVDLITFASVGAANQFERLTVAGTVNRYTRVIHTVATGAVTYHASFGRK